MTGESASAGPVRPAGDVDPNSVVAFGAEDFPDTADDWSDPSTDVTFADDFSVAQEDTSFAPEPELDVEMPGDVDIASDFDVVA